MKRMENVEIDYSPLFEKNNSFSYLKTPREINFKNDCSWFEQALYEPCL